MSELQVQRARPLLGTLVSIAIRRLPPAQAHPLIEAGFRAIEEIHRLMSFQEAASEVSRLNREAASHPVTVDPRTFEVLSQAIRFAAASNGVFDITVAAKLAEYGFLARPPGACEPDASASWRDIELDRGGWVRFHRPLWIDLSGIAKGFAVDQAIERMHADPEAQICVNAGGDLRVRGPAAQLVYLNFASDGLRAVRLEEGSLASSSGRTQRRAHGGDWVGPHIDGVRRRATGTHSFVSVLAQRCATADALTKIVLSQGVESESVLRRFEAIAYLHTSRLGWRQLGAPV